MKKEKLRKIGKWMSILGMIFAFNFWISSSTTQSIEQRVGGIISIGMILIGLGLEWFARPDKKPNASLPSS